MNQEQFFEKMLESQISPIGLKPANHQELIKKFLDRYKRNQFDRKPSSLLPEIKQEAKKLKKVEAK